jgi:hypothetical protein
MFSESAKLSILEVKDWADDEASKATIWLRMADMTQNDRAAAEFRRRAAVHQTHARWLFELLAEATVDREKT